MKEERVLTLNDYEYGVVVNALNEMRNDLIKEERPTDAPTKKVKRRNHETR